MQAKVNMEAIFFSERQNHQEARKISENTTRPLISRDLNVITCGLCSNTHFSSHPRGLHVTMYVKHILWHVEVATLLHGPHGLTHKE